MIARTANRRRRGAPTLRPPATVSKRLARPSDNLMDMSTALQNYEEDKYASSARASRQSVERTWLEYHVKAHAFDPVNVGADPFPITVASLKRIAALMELDGFRSFGNYASWAKATHIQRGFDWTQQLAMEITQAGRSVNRGIGPCR